MFLHLTTAFCGGLEEFLWTMFNLVCWYVLFCVQSTKIAFSSMETKLVSFQADEESFAQHTVMQGPAEKIGRSKDYWSEQAFTPWYFRAVGP